MGDRKVCFMDYDGGAGTCTRDDGDCDKCDFPDNVSNGKYSYNAWTDDEEDDDG